MSYEPRYDRDYSYGRQGELLVADVLSQISAGQVQVEVKRKRRPDDRVYVECEQLARGQDWKPSGIETSTAEYWAFVIGESGCFVLVPAVNMRQAIARGYARPSEERDGDNPTRGYLISLHALFQLGNMGAAS